MMETILRALASRLSAYGADYKNLSYYHGTLVLGEVEIDVELNVRRVVRICDKRFLFGSRRGYDYAEMVLHILRSLPALQERAKLEKAQREERKIHQWYADQCRELTKAGEGVLRFEYNEYAAEGKQLYLEFYSKSLDALRVAADMLREIEDFSRPAASETSKKGPMRFQFANGAGEPEGAELTLRSLAEMEFDLDRASMLVVGEVAYSDDEAYRVIRTA